MKGVFLITAFTACISLSAAQIQRIEFFANTTNCAGGTVLASITEANRTFSVPNNASVQSVRVLGM